MGEPRQDNMAYMEEEVILLSKDEREFKVKFGIVMMSETIKALSSFPEEEEDREDWSVPAASIPLPPVEGSILEKVSQIRRVDPTAHFVNQVIEYCSYHTEHKEAKEDETE